MLQKKPAEPVTRVHTDGPFAREEVRLANRNSGMLLEMLRHDVTPAGLHYLLIHFDVPYVASAAEWTLDIGGLVDKPLRLTLDELKNGPVRTLRVTMECAGNGRATISPRWQSQPWHHEAIGTAEWTGTPLKALLERAGLQPRACDIVFTGRDRGIDGGNEQNFARSLVPALAQSDDVLVAWAMNGAPLLPQHGFPLRLVVPGWFGMASVKWLERIEAIDRPFDGYQQTGTYIFRETPDEPGTPVTTLRVKSLMVPPGIPDFYSRTRIAEPGPITLFGRAWSGAGVPVTKVEVAVDGEWRDAALDPDAGRYAWRGWRCDVTLASGEHELMCRATDANGEVQPLVQRFDRGGFGNNEAQRVKVTVK